MSDESARAASVEHLARTIVTSGRGMGPWDHLTCTEADALSDVLVAFGHRDASDIVSSEHADADSDPDDEHHADYLAELARSVAQRVNAL